MKSSAEIILGIDPGTVIMGYAIIIAEKNTVSILHMDVLKLTLQSHTYKRLEVIFSKVKALIDEYKPTTFAIEAPFFGKNVQSMLKLGRAQGVAIAAAMQCDLPVTEYSPRKIKQSITGNGNASKEQVFKMLQNLLPLLTEPKYLDATDALAVAMCHHYANCNAIPLGKKSLKGWDDFIAKNPQRVKS